ncbi:MAG TPA: sporulation transcription factor Spo0A, partial [Clostridiaceae bacterium]|nr:sporulation transcription factor Spo0A [Clostridiaceae bacterium]
MEEKKIKIVIADDNKEFCNILCDYMKKESDFVVVGVAKDGVEALKLVSEESPDVLVLDIIMP